MGAEGVPVVRGEEGRGGQGGKKLVLDRDGSDAVEQEWALRRMKPDRGNTEPPGAEGFARS